MPNYEIQFSSYIQDMDEHGSEKNNVYRRVVFAENDLDAGEIASAMVGECFDTFEWVGKIISVERTDKVCSSETWNPESSWVYILKNLKKEASWEAVVENGKIIGARRQIMILPQGC